MDCDEVCLKAKGGIRQHCMRNVMNTATWTHAVLKFSSALQPETSSLPISWLLFIHT